VVEPVLILYFFCEFPVDIIVQRYVLDWITSALDPNDTARINSSSTSACSGNSSAADLHLQDRVQSLSSLFGVLESLVWGFPAVAATLVLGAGSDRLGRRFAVLPPLFGVVASSSVAHIVVRWRLSIGWLFVGDFLYGCCGSFTAMTMSCFAYVADRTSPERRMLRITVLEMCMLVSGVVSPIGLGSIVDRIGQPDTLLIIVAVSAVNFVYVFVFLPSSSSASGGHEFGKLPDVVVVEQDVDTTTDAGDVVEPSHQPTLTQSPAVAAAAADGPLKALQVGNSTSDVTARCESSIDDPIETGNPQSSGEQSTSCVGLLTSINNSDVLIDCDRPRSGRCQPRSESNDVNIDANEPRSDCSEPRSGVDGGRAVEGKTWRLIVDGVGRLVSLFVAPGPRRAKLCLLLVAFFVTSLPTFDFSLATLFEMNRPLCWSINTIGVFTGASLGVSTVGALIAAPLMKRCLPDVGVAVWAGLTAVATNVYKSFVATSVMMYLSVSLSMFSILLIPSIRSVMSSLVADHEQGSVFGAVASVEVICGILGTVIFNSVYSSTLYIASGFVFVVMAMFYAIGTTCLVIYCIRLKLESRVQHSLLRQPSVSNLN
jgi:MFS family permease